MPIIIMDGEVQVVIIMGYPEGILDIMDFMVMLRQFGLELTLHQLLLYRKDYTVEAVERDKTVIIPVLPVLKTVYQVM